MPVTTNLYKKRCKICSINYKLYQGNKVHKSHQTTSDTPTHLKLRQSRYTRVTHTLGRLHPVTIHNDLSSARSVNMSLPI